MHFWIESHDFLKFGEKVSIVERGGKVHWRNSKKCNKNSILDFNAKQRVS
jgi:hypothetical protein